MNNEKRNYFQSVVVKVITESKFRGYVDVCPRFGKSKVICDAINESGFSNILIVIPINDMKKSWKEELKKWKVDKKVSFLNKSSLIKKDLTQYDLIVVDEIHSLSERQRNMLKNDSLKHIIGVSGSISDSTKEQLKSLNLDCLYTFSIEDGVDEGIISDFQIYLVPVTLNNTKAYVESGSKTRKFKVTESNHYNYLTKNFEKMRSILFAVSKENSSDRNKKIGKYSRLKMFYAGKRASSIYTYKSKIYKCKQILDSFDRAIVFSARTDVANELAPSHNSKSTHNNLQKFIDKKIDKLSLVEMANMGITFPDLKIGIFHQMKSSEEGAIQKVMRMCNLEDDKPASIFITYYENTVDEQWVKSALNGFSEKRINLVTDLKHTIDAVKQSLS